VERFRIHADAAIYYLTYSVVEWLPMFVSRASCQDRDREPELLSSCERTRVSAYVIISTHLPMIVFDAEWGQRATEANA
jgi:putative transposase